MKIKLFPAVLGLFVGSPMSMGVDTITLPYSISHWDQKSKDWYDGMEVTEKVDTVENSSIAGF